MSQLAACSLLLLLLCGQYGLQDKVALRTLPSNMEPITCTGDLVCEMSDMMCMPGDMVEAEYPVLVPSSIEAETMRRCNGDNCSLCVQLTVNVSVAFLTERNNEDFGSADCDYGYYDSDESDDEEEEEQEEEVPIVNVYLRLNSSNGSLLCANMFISHLSAPKFDCQTMRVSLPLSSVPQTHNTNSLVVGSLVYNCIAVAPSTEMNITSYTVPRYSSVVSTSYEVPGCLQLDEGNNIWRCGAPTLDIVDKTSIGIVNGTNDRKIHIQLKYDNQTTGFTITGDQRHNISQSDIMPCLCIFAWYSDMWPDPVKVSACPYRNYPDDRTLQTSRLTLDNGKLAVFTLNTYCKTVAEASLCWKSIDQPDCREIPQTRRMIKSEEIYQIEGLELPHPSLCVQVKAKGELLHTKCLNVSTSPVYKNEAILVLEHKPINISICQVEAGGCRILYDAKHQINKKLEFLEERMVEDVLTDRCVKILSHPNQDVFLCSPDKYMRSRWIWSRVLCLLIVATVLLVLLLRNEDLKRWLKSLTAEKSLGEIFRDRRVLILYSPDSPAYEELIRVFASSLKELRLDVVLDQWNRTEMSLINPLTWYQKEKTFVFKKGGVILLLLSDKTQERYIEWKDQNPQQISDSDPYGTSGAVLNCIYSDFQKGSPKEGYLVACFDIFNKDYVAPELFKSLSTYTLPSNLVKLLYELAGDSAKRLRRKQAKQLSIMISDTLKGPLKACQDGRYRTTVISQAGSDISESVLSDGGVSLELQPLM